MGEDHPKRWKYLVVVYMLFLMSVVTLGSLIHQLPEERRREVRDFEKVSRKIAKTRCSLLFNSTCLKENILPNYSDIYIYDGLSRRVRRMSVSTDHGL